MSNLKFNEEHFLVKIPGSNGKGLSTIITSPHALYHEDFYSKGYEPSSNKMVLIVHGNGGHKNYCYQSILAEKLLSELGIFSVRFDFRNCGDSEDNADESQGRVIGQDVKDIDTIAHYFADGSYKGIKFCITGIVSHSRGSAAMFLWALKQHELLSQDEDAIYVPNLVNCAGRFDYLNHLKRILKSYPNWENDGHYKMTNIYRHGEYTEITIPKVETYDISSIDLRDIGKLDSNVLSVYGLDDITVPLEDSSTFANILGDKHELKFIKNADHNYYGTNPPSTETGQFVPVNSRGQYNYNYMVADYITEYLSHVKEVQRFYSSHKIISSLPRWKDVEGIANFRDIGGWRISKDKYVRPNFGFRCALPSRVTTRGRKTIENLNIKAVFDFRSLGECKRDGALEIPESGVKRFHLPIMKDEGDGSPEALMLQYKNLLTSWATYKDIYRDILKQGVESFKTVFTFIRDHPEDSFLFHCTAGKDRTGVMGMLIFLVCGLDNLTISKEYELTTIGLKPMHDYMRKGLNAVLGKFGDIAKEASLGRENWTVEKDGFANIISSRSEAMLATIDMFNREFGGIEKYMTTDMGFDKKDLQTIRANLTISRSLL